MSPETENLEMIQSQYGGRIQNLPSQAQFSTHFDIRDIDLSKSPLIENGGEITGFSEIKVTGKDTQGREYEHRSILLSNSFVRWIDWIVIASLICLVAVVFFNLYHNNLTFGEFIDIIKPILIVLGSFLLGKASSKKPS